MTRVSFATDSPDAVYGLRVTLGPERFDELVSSEGGIGQLDAKAAADRLADNGSDVVIFGSDVDLVHALCIAEIIDREHPEIETILIASPTDELYELALQAGVRFVVAPDAASVQVRGVVERALTSTERRRENIVIDLRDRMPAPPVEEAETARVITVLSPKGGAGKTTIATNLAVGLARLAPRDVAIVDLDLQFGDVASALQLTPQHTLADLAGSGVHLDRTAVKVLLTPYDDELYALCGSDDPALGEEITSELVGPALRALASDLRYVVVDTSAGIDSAALAAIEVSTDLVLVGAMDVPSVRSVRKLINVLDRLEVTTPRRHVVLNRADSRVGIEPSDVEATLGHPIAVSIPSSRSIPLSVNQGCPVLISDPKAPVVRPLEQLVSLFHETTITATTGGRSWRRRHAG